MKITQFTMEEVRCFAERQQFDIRPLTFLVGENSTGKTTMLACFQALANYLKRGEMDFNSQPYALGIFRDIVRNSQKKEKAFRLGFAVEGDSENVEYTVEFVQKRDGFEPAIASIKIKFTDGEIVFKYEDTGKGEARLTDFDETKNQYHIEAPEGFPPFFRFSPFFDLTLWIRMLKGKDKGKHALKKYVKQKYQSARYPGMMRDISVSSPTAAARVQSDNLSMMRDISVVSLSPIRARPKRTYDPTREFNDPEGSDVPMRLMRTQATKKERWEGLKQKLVEFGKHSELFQNIEIKNLGGSLGAPFQLKVKVRGPSANLIDVGYGVSQILPILVQILDADIYRNARTTFLLQQPEVHLHPKAQAQLSSLLVELANHGSPAFIVETHSDYMIDRARIEIRRGNISPKDVSLIYLEPKGRVVHVHNIRFDKMANMLDVPPHYGKFFLQETDRLMGFED